VTSAAFEIVPDIDPVLEFKLKPAGRLPETTVQFEYGCVPPVALNVF